MENATFLTMQQDSILLQTFPASYRPRLFIKNGLFSQTLESLPQNGRDIIQLFSQSSPEDSDIFSPLKGFVHGGSFSLSKSRV